MTAKTMHLPNPATAEEVRGILGRADEELVGEILATGATRNDVLEAFGWLEADEQMSAGLRRRLEGRAAEVYELLKAAEAPAADER